MHTDPKQKEVEKLISEKIKAIAAIMKECEQIAEENEVDFSFNPLDIWGMGATYCPKTLYIKEYMDPEEDAEEIQRIMETDEPDYEGGWGWRSSSSNC